MWSQLLLRLLILDRVFHQDGKAISMDNIRWAHNSVCKKAKIEGFNFHDFRHTCINNWRKEGHDYFKIMAVSGHKTISVFKRYNMVDEGELRTLVNPWSKSSQINKNPSEMPSNLSQNSSMVSGA